MMTGFFRGAVLVISLMLSVSLPATHATAQGYGSMYQLFGGMMQLARSEAARKAWQHVSEANLECLEQHNLSVDSLIQQGITPYNPQVRAILAQCRQAASAPPPPAPVEPAASAPTPSSYNRIFNVAGLPLGGTVYPNSPAYARFACRPSDQFAGFTWCKKKETLRGKHGPETSQITMLHSQDNRVFYISHSIAPRYFTGNDIPDEIQKLNGYGLTAQVLKSEDRPDAPHGTIAYWGGVVLTPLSTEQMDMLRNKHSPNAGILFDFLDDVYTSATLNLPVYRVTGTGGFILGATYDTNGRGSIRLTTIDDSVLHPGDNAPATTEQPAPTTGGGVSVAAVQPAAPDASTAPAPAGQQTAADQAALDKANADKEAAESRENDALKAQLQARVDADELQDKLNQEQKAAADAQQAAQAAGAAQQEAENRAAAAAEKARAAEQEKEKEAAAAAAQAAEAEREKEKATEDAHRQVLVAVSAVGTFLIICIFVLVLVVLKSKSRRQVSAVGSDVRPEQVRSLPPPRPASIETPPDVASAIAELPGAAQAGEPVSAAETTASPLAQDLVAEITKFGELHAAGILTDDEFGRLKAKILNSDSFKGPKDELVPQLRALRDANLLTPEEFQAKVLETISMAD